MYVCLLGSRNSSDDNQPRKKLASTQKNVEFACPGAPYFTISKAKKHGRNALLRFRQQQGDVRHKFAPEVTVKTLKGYVASHINVRMMTSALEKGNALNISQIVLEFDPDDNTTVMV